MNIEDLMAMVDEDIGKPLRRDLVDWEASRTQSLHQKYRKILYAERVELNRMQSGIDPLRKQKRIEYLEGDSPLRLDPKKKITTEEKTASKKVIKDEVMFWIDADPDVMKARELVSLQAEKVEYLKDVLDDIRKRSFHLGIILNTQRFKHGLENLGQVIEMDDPNRD